MSGRRRPVQEVQRYAVLGQGPSLCVRGPAGDNAPVAIRRPAWTAPPPRRPRPGAAG